MNTVPYYASFIFEVRDGGVEILESAINTLDPEYSGSDDLPFIEDIIKENPPAEYGVYKRVEFGFLIYEQDYWSEWECDIQVEKESVTKMSKETEIEYLRRFN